MQDLRKEPIENWPTWLLNFHFQRILNGAKMSEESKDKIRLEVRRRVSSAFVFINQGF